MSLKEKLMNNMMDKQFGNMSTEEKQQMMDTMMGGEAENPMMGMMSMMMGGKGKRETRECLWIVVLK